MPDDRHRELRLDHGDARLEEVLAVCLDAERLGIPIDRAALMERHPALAAELAEFLKADQWLKGISSPISLGRAAGYDVASPGSVSNRVPRDHQDESATTAVPPSARKTGLDDEGGLRLGKYRLIRELGRGGMGVVYEGWQDGVNRAVAVKVISSGPFASAEELKRFRTEAEAAANLSHPGLVPIYEVDVCDGHPFYSMELVAGQSLSELAAAGDLSPERAAGFVAAVAEAVDYAHRHGVVHRDLKPANILIDTAGRPRVTDFGLAKRLDHGGRPGSDAFAATVEAMPGVVSATPNGESLTRTGAVLGTPAYMAPEQAAGERTVGPSVDIYGLGAVLYHLLTGRPPFKGPTAIDTLRLVLDGRIEPVKQVKPAIPGDLAIIVETCLNRDPADRYRTAADVADDLQRFLAGEPIRAGRISMWGRVSRVVGQSRHVSHFRRWGRVVVAFGLIVFLAHVVMQVLNRVGASEWWSVATRMTMLGLMLVALRHGRSGSLFPRDAVERLVWVVWTAYLMAYFTVEVVTVLSGNDHAFVYPIAAILGGMAFFTLGCHVWGACYLVGLSFFLAAPLLVLVPDVAVLGFGTLWGLSLTALGLRYDRLNRTLPDDE